MSPVRALLGIEGGGSTARAALECGQRIVARASSFSLNPLDTGLRSFEQRLSSLLRPLCGTSSCRASSVVCCAALAGVGDPDVRRRCKAVILKVLERLWSDSRLRLITDVDAVVEGYLHRRDGMALIAGTGSICVGVRWRRGQRIVERVGGWGGTFDDGSGFQLGMQVLKAAFETADGKRRRDMVTDILCSRYGLALREVASRFLPLRRDQVAGLATVALEAYAAGDPYATTIVRKAVSDLVGMARSVARRLGLTGDIDIILVGGLWRSPVVHNLFVRRVKRALPGARPETAGDPVWAVLSLARGQVLHSSTSAGPGAGHPRRAR